MEAWGTNGRATYEHFYKGPAARDGWSKPEGKKGRTKAQSEWFDACGEVAKIYFGTKPLTRGPNKGQPKKTPEKEHTNAVDDVVRGWMGCLDVSHDVMTRIEIVSGLTFLNGWVTWLNNKTNTEQMNSGGSWG